MLKIGHVLFAFFSILSVAWADSAQADVVQMISADVAVSGHDHRSSVGTRVEVKELKDPDGETTFQPVVTVTVDGTVVGQLAGVETSQQPSALVQLVQLDHANPYPEVLISSFTFGAHCCSEVKVLTSDASGKTWTEVDLGHFDGGAIEATDPVGDGQYVIHSYDNRFLYQFGCYACSFAPARILQLEGTTVVDVTRHPKYVPVHRKNLAVMAEWFKESERTPANPFLAAYVANKALVGELADGWKTMLELYDAADDWGLKVCEAGTDDNGRCKADEIKREFPVVLKAFLAETGHISSGDQPD